MDSVHLGLMAEKDAERTGRMILHDNAARMYGLEMQPKPFNTEKTV